MKNFTSIDQTFKAIRQLPLEVSFGQVKKWINELPAISHAKKTEAQKTKWSFLKSMFPPISKN